MNDAQSDGRDDRTGGSIRAAPAPVAGRRRSPLSNGNRLRILGALLLAALVAALFEFRPQRSGGTDLRLRALIDRVEGMALVVPGAEEMALEPFFLDRFEVTNAEFAHYLEQTGRSARDWPAPSLAPSAVRYAKERGKEPVVFVSQPEAKAFAAFQDKRLPSEREWRYAAGFGANSDWDSLSRYRMNLLETGLGRPARIGTFEGGRTRVTDRIAPPVYDLIGNVAEWCSADGDPAVITPVAPVMGGSFNDSILDARARFAQDTAAIDDRNFALGFRCVRADAEGWLRSIGDEIAATGQLRREHVERMRRFGDPLGRLIERARLRDATLRTWFQGGRIDVSDRYQALGDGSVLRFHDDRLERIDVVAGPITMDEVIGVCRELPRQIGGTSTRAFARLPDSRTRATTSSVWMTRSASGAFELRSDRFEPIVEAKADSRSTLPRSAVPIDSLPQGLLTAPYRWLPVALSDSGTRNRIVEFVVDRGELSIRTRANLPAVDEVVIAPAADWIYTRDSISFQLPDTEYALPFTEFGTGLTIVGVYGAKNGERMAAVAVPGASIAIQPAIDDPGRVVVAAEDGCLRIDDVFERAPRVQRSVWVDPNSVRIVEASAFEDDGLVLEVRDDAAQIAYLMRVDSRGELRATRRLDTFDVRATRVVVVDSDTLLLLGAEDSLWCLDGRLEQKWVARGSPYTFEFCPPVVFDLDRDGAREFVVPFGREGIFGIVSHDASTGKEVERLTTQGHLVLALLAPTESSNGKQLFAAVRELGLLELRAPHGPREQVLRELERALGRGRRGRAP